MKKDKEWLKEAVGKLNLVDTVFEADGVSYIDTAVSVVKVYDLIDQLDEPGKIVVPKFVAEWYEESKNELEFDIFNLVTTIGEKDYDELTEIEAWFNNLGNEPIETIMKMKLFGYEAEKEKLYYVLNKQGKTLLVFIGGKASLSGGYALPDGNKEMYQLTEKQIKDYDERFWEFAVEVAEC